jgi:predicted permease
MRRALDLTREALRALRGHPRFTLLAMLALALGIGLNTAAFSALYALLWRPLPYRDAGRLLLLAEDQLSRGETQLSLSPPAFREWQRRGRCFASLGGAAVAPLTLTVGGEPEMVKGALITPAFFATLGVHPTAGRLPDPAEGAVISDRLWRQRFGADPRVIGRPIHLGASLLPIVGVAPAEVETPGGTQVWVPLAMAATFFPNVPGLLENGGARLLLTYARRRTSCSPDALQADLKRVSGLLATDFPATHQGVTASVVSLRERAAQGMRRSLVVLQAGAGVALLVLCANLANLMLARGLRRARELAVRSALGASPRRLVGQLLLESGLLAAGGGALGLGVAWGMIRVLVALAPPQLPYTARMGLQAPVALAGIAAALAAGMLAGIVPALRAARADPREALQGSPAGGGQGPEPGASALVIFETALTACLLIAGGLLLRSYHRLERVEPGFSPQGVLALSVSLPPDRYPDARSLARFYPPVLEEIGRRPGVLRASAASDLPLLGSSCSVEATAEGEAREIACQAVTPGYSQTLGIPLLEGRSFEPRDLRTGATAVLANARLAALLWPGQDPLGRRLTIRGGRRLAGGAQTAEVVGVLGDVRQEGLDQEAPPLLYLPELWNNMSILVRTAGDPARFAGAARQAVWSVDRRQPLYRVAPFTEVLGTVTAGARFNATLVGAIGIFSILVAALGLFGVLAHTLGQRRRELAIRLALGATRHQVMALLIGRALALAAAGSLLGVLLALALGKTLASLLFGVTATDPATIGAVVLLLLAVALATSYVPARSAARTDPAVSLRAE